MLREEIDETTRVLVPTSPIAEVIEEAHRGPEMAQEGSKNVLERLVHYYYWHRMKKDVKLHRASCPTWDTFHNASKRHRAKLNTIVTNVR